MATGPLNDVLRRLRGLTPHLDDSDERLLERFLAQREEGAFTALLRRHGPMVWGVCRRLLPCAHDAEDAFQATFLVLVRKAATVVPRGRVGNWLYGVAYRTALEARSAAARRHVKERQTARPVEAIDVPPGTEFWALLDEELCRLPANYRAAVVLCDLEGRSRKEAAHQLGWPEGTLSGRLARARDLLAKRLTRRGVTLGGLVAAALAPAAAPALPAALLTETLKAATAGAIAPRVAALTTGVLQTMTVSKVKLIAAALVLTLGLVVWGSSSLADNAVPATQQGAPKQADKLKQKEPSDTAQKLAEAIDKLIEKRYVEAVRDYYENLMHGKRGKRVETDFIVKTVDGDFPLVNLVIPDTQLTIPAVRIAQDASLREWDGKKLKKIKYADLKPGMRVTIWVETRKDRSVVVGLTAYDVDREAGVRASALRALEGWLERDPNRATAALKLLRLRSEQAEKDQSERELMRRMWLDLFGELPSPEEVRMDLFRALMDRARREAAEDPKKK